MEIKDNEKETIDDDIEALKRRAQELENEVKRLESESSEKAATAQDVGESEEFVPAKDDHSVYIGNLHHDITPEDLQSFFRSCGVINRITIICNKHTGKPKGFAYMEFEDKESVEMALGLNETELNGRPLIVSRKRKNVPKFLLRQGRGGRRGRGYRSRGYRGRGRGRYNPY